MKDYWYDKVEVSVFMCTKDDVDQHPTLPRRRGDQTRR